MITSCYLPLSTPFIGAVAFSTLQLVHLSSIQLIEGHHAVPVGGGGGRVGVVPA
jgi:hypothetical protein